MTDDMQSRRRNAAVAFIKRRGELDLSQEQVATRAGVAPRTVFNFENGRWPNPATRHKLEKAVGWRSGEIHRLASPAKAYMDPSLMDELSQLTPEQKRFAIRFLQEDLGLPAAPAVAEEEE